MNKGQGCFEHPMLLSAFGALYISCSWFEETRMFLAETVWDYVVTRAAYMLIGATTGAIAVVILNSIKKTNRRVDDMESRLELLEVGPEASPPVSLGD